MVIKLQYKNVQMHNVKDRYQNAQKKLQHNKQHHKHVVLNIFHQVFGHRLQRLNPLIKYARQKAPEESTVLLNNCLSKGYKGSIQWNIVQLKLYYQVFQQVSYKVKGQINFKVKKKIEPLILLTGIAERKSIVLKTTWKRN